MVRMGTPSLATQTRTDGHPEEHADAPLDPSPRHLSAGHLGRHHHQLLPATPRAGQPRRRSSSTRLAQRGAVSPATLKALEAEFGVNTNDPLWVQYITYLNNLIHGNLGVSITLFPASVGDVIGQDIKWTLVLLSVSVLLSFSLGTLVGIFMAWNRGTAFDTAALLADDVLLLHPLSLAGNGRRLLPRLQPGLVPLRLRLRHLAHPRLERRVPRQRRLSRHPARAHADRLDHRRLDAHHAQLDGHHPLRGLRAAGRAPRASARGG